MALELYEQLKKERINVLLDVRDVRAGEKFADADLIGAPVRVIVSTKNIEKNVLEVKYRINSEKHHECPCEIPMENFLSQIKEVIEKLK